MQERKQYRDIAPPMQSLELSSDSEQTSRSGSHERFFTAHSNELNSYTIEDPQRHLQRTETSSSSLSQLSLRISPRCSIPESDARIEKILARQEDFENEVQESLNMLTDRINGLEFEGEERWSRCESSISGVRTQVKSMFTELVRKIIKVVQLIPASKAVGSTTVREVTRDRVQSRIGMRRARVVTPRE